MENKVLEAISVLQEAYGDMQKRLDQATETIGQLKAALEESKARENRLTTELEEHKRQLNLYTGIVSQIRSLVPENENKEE